MSPHIPGNCACLPLRENRLVCVEYPAVIQNLDRALESLGGEHNMSKTYANPNRRLELRLRPQDPFCHSLCGNRLDSSNLLLRVRRRVRKSDPTDVQIQTEILGIIVTTYKFQGMADFQCLAVHPENGSKMSLYDRIVLTRPESQDFFEQPLPYFLPPAIFSRLDTPIDYFYRPDVTTFSPLNSYYLNPIICSPHKNFIGLNRARRPHNAIFVTFLDSVPNDLWVRLGYDPRKSTESKHYQMLDFRIRCSTKHGYSVGDVLVKPKRSSLSYTLPNTFNKTVPRKQSIERIQTRSYAVVSFAQESAYIFREGMVPPHRQMFYQLCDLHVDSIQRVVNANKGLEKKCDERDGWCVVGTTDQLRDIISECIQKVVRSKKNKTYEDAEDEPGGALDETKEEEEVEFQLSEGSENEMETDMQEYM
uniref:Uncharacterized protein n=1 Tax=Periophthalmus magnuspinnatus TaxID=409849 RepID=A0A3B3ZSE1_9GOBI